MVKALLPYLALAAAALSPARGLLEGGYQYEIRPILTKQDRGWFGGDSGADG